MIPLTTGEIAGMHLALLPDRATVYTRAPTTGLYTVVARANLPVRVLAGASGGGAGGFRAEQAGQRRILFDPAYSLPDDVMLTIAGVTYDPIEGTEGRDPETGTAVVRRVDAAIVQDET